MDLYVYVRISYKLKIVLEINLSKTGFRKNPNQIKSASIVVLCRRVYTTVTKPNSST